MLSIRGILFKIYSKFKLSFLSAMVKKATLQEVIKENKQYGFDDSVIEIAYANVDGDSSRVMEQIFRLQSQSLQIPTKPANAGDEDAQMSKAIEASMYDAKEKKIILEPLNPEQRVRKSGVPVGMKNVGNTCYFNSLLQAYFQNWAFVKEVLHYEIPSKYKLRPEAEQKKINSEDFELKRKQASCKLVENLKFLFVALIASDRKYIDPTDVVTTVVDDYGNDLPIGDQKDIGQFNLVFLSRVDQGLSLAKKEKMMDIESESLEKKPSDDSTSRIHVFGESGDLSESMVKRSSIKLDEKSIIAKQFFGKMHNSYINEKENIHISEEELFSLLFLNVKYKEMYRACEEVAISHIDDYRNEKGEVIGVEKQSWIKEAPKTLFFQIDRVVFNKEKCAQEKVNSIFDFQKVFYVDPFLLKNKVKALEIQKTVRKLRQEKEEYEIALKDLESFGEKGFNLLDLLTYTAEFLNKQSSTMDMQKQTNNAAFFPELKSQINPDQIALLSKYKSSVEQRINKYHTKISQIEKQIQNQYALIRSVPYYLYSILVHEGSADSGHYYSYSYDFDRKVWKKYNDINITEEPEEQVIKEAKGINFRSAYYLIYAQKEVLHPDGSMLPLRNWKLSTQEGYMEDQFSEFMSTQLKNKVKMDNQLMYYEIEQYKAGGFVTRVIDSYIRKFETWNQIYRKNKQEKKKNNTPPILLSFPVFIKSVSDDNQYKNVLIENCILDYGPKQANPVFLDMVQKKLVNLNDFKKPKDLHSSKPQLIGVFLNHVYRAVASKKLYNAIKESQYHGIFGLLRQLKSAAPGDYFQWVGNLLSKVLAVRFLVEAEENTHEKSQVGIQKLRFLALLLFNFINLEEEKQLVLNCIFWIKEIAPQMVQPQKTEAQKIDEMISGKSYNKEYDEIILNKINQTIVADIKNGVEIQDAMWNMSRKENTFVDEMLAARNQTKSKMEVANNIYREMKKENLPLKREDREKIKFKANN